MPIRLAIPDPRRLYSPHSLRFCPSSQRKLSISEGASLDLPLSLPPASSSPTGAGGSERTNPSIPPPGWAQCVCVPAAPLSAQNCPPAASPRGAGEPGPRGTPRGARTPLAAPAVHPGGGRAGGPRSRPGWRSRAPKSPRPCPGRSAGRAGSCPSAPGSGPNGGSQPSRPGRRQLARVSWPRGGPGRSFPERPAYLCAPGATAARRSGGEAAAGAPVAVRSRGRRGREAPLARTAAMGRGRRRVSTIGAWADRDVTMARPANRSPEAESSAMMSCGPGANRETIELS